MKVKQIIAMALIGLGTVFGTTSALAAADFTEAQETIDDTSMFLISETSETLDDGTIEITRLYSSVNPYSRAKSGSGTFKNEKELVFSNEGSTPLKYWVQGLFTWDSEKKTATVTNRVYGHGTVNSSCKIKDENKTYGNNQGNNIMLGRKYAFMRYTFTFVNVAGFERSADVYLDVNIDGVSSTN